VIDRRAFIAVIGGGLLAAPPAAGAQPARKGVRIGYLISGPSLPLPPELLPRVFVPAMNDLGYVEGDNLVIEIRSADNKPERLPALAAELVRLNVDVIVTRGDGEVRAAKQATSTIPIVMAPSGDPVRAGYVASLARPGGNVTGLSWVSPDLSTKLLEVLKDTVLNLSRIAVLWNAANPMKVLDFNETQRAAQTLGLTVYSIEMKAPSELEAAFAAITRTRPDALLMLVDEVLATGMFPRIADFALKQRLPSIIGEPRYAAAGGLMAYGPSAVDMLRRAASYVDKILKGAKPADLPIQQPTTFELVINLKTAKALGLTIPPSLLQRADQVIE
jgi:putative ABC transport system substrate-binding protein